MFATAKERELQNYIEELEEAHEGEVEKLQSVIAKKNDDIRKVKSNKNGQLRSLRSENNVFLRSKMRLQHQSALRLANWHAERDLHRAALDELLQQKKIALQTEKVLERYKSFLNESDENKRAFQKEWATEEAARRRGGARRWPTWVVQLICELLINGTAPSAIPKNIMSMYAILFGKNPEEHPPSVDFVRQCRPMVQVIGETVAAIKLANADTWDQLWTDATTRRQIPFTALIIGLLWSEGGDAIEPVVVSSCIFMEDETAQKQSNGIIDKVSD